MMTDPLKTAYEACYSKNISLFKACLADGNEWVKELKQEPHRMLSPLLMQVYQNDKAFARLLIENGYVVSEMEYTELFSLIVHEKGEMKALALDLISNNLAFSVKKVQSERLKDRMYGFMRTGMIEALNKNDADEFQWFFKFIPETFDNQFEAFVNNHSELFVQAPDVLKWASQNNQFPICEGLVLEVVMASAWDIFSNLLTHQFEKVKKTHQELCPKLTPENQVIFQEAWCFIEKHLLQQSLTNTAQACMKPSKIRSL